MLDEIIKSASALGACKQIDEANDYRSLTTLFFSPQGQEFCKKHNFPSLEIFRQIKNDIERKGIYIDCGTIDLPEREHICLIGDTTATIEASGVEYVHTIILMHGAKAIINASNYAVLHIVNVSGLDVTINKDNTVAVL